MPLRRRIEMRSRLCRERRCIAQIIKSLCPAGGIEIKQWNGKQPWTAGSATKVFPGIIFYACAPKLVQNIWCWYLLILTMINVACILWFHWSCHNFAFYLNKNFNSCVPLSSLSFLLKKFPKIAWASDKNCWLVSRAQTNASAHCLHCCTLTAITFQFLHLHSLPVGVCSLD
jgi:hypothetical protein